MQDQRPFVSMREIARQIGVSHAAVSMALRNSPEISLRRRKQIHTLAAKLGYRPDPALQQLAGYRRASKLGRVETCIAWLSAWNPARSYFGYQEYAEYWSGATKAADQLGFRLESFSLPKAAPTPARLVQILQARGIRGILIPPHRETFDYVDCDWGEFAVVKIGFSVPQLRAHLVTSDQYGGGQLAARRMIEAGYSRIAFVSTGLMERHTRGNFTAAFLHTRDSLAPSSQGIAPLFLLGQDLGSDRKAFAAWFGRHKPDALLFSSMSVPTFLAEMGLQAPVDIGLCAISLLDARVDTGLNQFPEEIGRAAIELLAGLLSTRQFGVPLHPRCVLVEPSWVTGKTLPLLVRSPTNASKARRS